MAEEKKDGLEGLDNFDDDFGEQLDSFMESDGDEESDSELDSFFEDLSTIDDLDGDEDSDDFSGNKEEMNKDEIKNESPESKTENEINVEDASDFDDESHFDDDPHFEDEEKENTKSVKENKKKGFPLKAAFVSSITGIILGIITIIVMDFVQSPSEKELQKVVIKKPVKKRSVAKIVKPKLKQKIIKKQRKKKITQNKSKKLNYEIQVVSCISKECLDESRTILDNLGYKPKIRNSTKKTGIPEVISSSILSEEKSAKIIKNINNINPLAGYAFSKPAKNGYHISLGYYPELETANRVRTYLNQAFKDKIFFEIKNSTQKINFQVVEVSGLNSIEDAEILLDKLKETNPNFETAFLKPLRKK